MEALQLGAPRGQVPVGLVHLLDLLEEALDELLVQLPQVPGLLGGLDLLPLAPQELGDHAGEAVNVDRLGDVAVAPGGEDPLPVAGVRVGRERHDERRGKGGKRAERGRRLVAVEARETDVQQDEVGPLANRLVDALQTILGLEELVPLSHQEPADETPVVRVVLDVEDLHRLTAADGLSHGGPRARGPAPAAA